DPRRRAAVLALGDPQLVAGARGLQRRRDRGERVGPRGAVVRTGGAAVDEPDDAGVATRIRGDGTARLAAVARDRIVVVAPGATGAEETVAAARAHGAGQASGAVGAVGVVARLGAGVEDTVAAGGGATGAEAVVGVVGVGVVALVDAGVGGAVAAGGSATDAE